MGHGRPSQRRVARLHHKGELLPIRVSTYPRQTELRKQRDVSSRARTRSELTCDFYLDLFLVAPAAAAAAKDGVTVAVVAGHVSAEETLVGAIQVEDGEGGGSGLVSVGAPPHGVGGKMLQGTVSSHVSRSRAASNSSFCSSAFSRRYRIV